MARLRSKALQVQLAALVALLCLHVVSAAPTAAADEVCSSEPSSSLSFQNVAERDAKDDEYVLRLSKFNQSSFTAQPYVANGYIGARLPAAGHGFQSFAANASDPKLLGQGWPLFGPRVTASIVAGFYDVQYNTTGTNFAQNGGEQVISLLPSWPALYVTLRKNGSSDLAGGSDATYAPMIKDDEVKNWTQSMSIRDGLIVTDVQWAPAILGNNSPPVSLKYSVYAHRSRPTLGLMRVDVSNIPDGVEAIVTDVIDGRGAARTQTAKAGKADAKCTIYSSVQPMGLPSTSAYLFSRYKIEAKSARLVSHPMSIGKILDINGSATSLQSALVAKGSKSFSAWKAVGIASTDAFGKEAESVAKQTASYASQSSWKTLYEEHQAAWSEIWKNGGSIDLEGSNSTEAGGSHDEDAVSKSAVSKLQTQARASLFHLLTNVRQGDEKTGLGDNSIPPAGLTSDSYASSIFWDAETFMFPALSILYPKFSESILNYRHRRPKQLEANAHQYGKPGILNSWIGARYQNCTGIGPCYDYEYHINNDIAFAHWQYYYQTRNQTFLEQKAFPILHHVSQFWAAQVYKRNASEDTTKALGQSTYETRNLTDPDEYANFKNNGAFTNAGITLIMLEALKMAEKLGKSPESIGASNWSSIANHLTLLRSPSSGIIYEYEGFNATVSVKQADVSLLIYPLEFNNRFPQKQPQPAADLGFYSGATSPNGPGMTYSMYGIARTQLDGTEGSKTEPNCEGYTRLLQAGMPYEREYSQFSEQVDDNVLTNGGTNPAYTFLTAHGGLLQMYSHGFLGYRARNDTEHVMYIDPNLPPQLEKQGITVSGVRHGQSTVDVVIKSQGTTVTHRSGKGPLTIQAGMTGKQQKIAVGSKANVPTRTLETMFKANQTKSTNYALCKPIRDIVASDKSGASSTAHAGTNLAQGANDGSVDTYFQPATVAPTSVIIDLGQERTLKTATLNWGSFPPKTVSLALCKNGKGDDQKVLANNMPVTISAQTNASAAAIVQLPTAYNMTTIDLAKDHPSSADRTGRYVNLTMTDVLTPSDKGYGATLIDVVLS